jgi:HSP20 family molecular chaperone IbpA
MNGLDALVALLGGGQDGAMGADPRGKITYKPTMNVYQDPEKYVIMVPLPGARGEDITLSIEEITGDRHIHLTATVRDPFAEKVEFRIDPGAPDGMPSASYLVKEYPFGAMDRCLGMPTDVNPEKITSSLENGLLLVLLPREKGQRTKSVPVKTITIKQD